MGIILQQAKREKKTFHLRVERYLTRRFLKDVIAWVNWIFKTVYFMAEVVHAEKEHSDWFPERSVFSYTDHCDGPYIQR